MVNYRISKYLFLKHLLISIKTRAIAQAIQKNNFWRFILGFPGAMVAYPQSMFKYISVKYELISKKLEP